LVDFQGGPEFCLRSVGRAKPLIRCAQKSVRRREALSLKFLKPDRFLKKLDGPAKATFCRQIVPANFQQS
jgi:hypothetical protein